MYAKYYKEYKAAKEKRIVIIVRDTIKKDRRHRFLASVYMEEVCGTRGTVEKTAINHGSGENYYQAMDILCMKMYCVHPSIEEYGH